MPKLAKIRIAGCRYDNFRKRHENSIFDLTREGEPDHTLFTLNNQGGKGVLMQLISQIVIPETRWGKKGGNKITGMFYDQFGRLRPYTFHVILEWKLDTVPDKWLITGICMTAFLRNEEEGEEEKERQAGLNYFLYTHEHRGDTYFTSENIPVYDKREKKAADYREFESFIDDNRKYFMKYSQGQSKRLDSDYYNYLRSVGIVKPEWEILKNINKSEGGVGDYFAQASDNKSIFDKFIIPAISENMKNYMEEDQDSLKEMFKSNLSITKNLPILLKREGDYRELLFNIEPVIESADVGMRRQEMMERCISEGNNIYAVLNNIYGDIEREIEKWSKERHNALNLKKELSFEKDNLPYAVLVREEGDLAILREESQREREDIAAAIEVLSNEEKEYKISELLLEKKEIETEEKNSINKKTMLLEMLKLGETEEEIKALDGIIKVNWKETLSQWEKISQNHYSYINYLNNKRKILEKSKAKENNEITKKNVEVRYFEDKEKSINLERKSLEEKFDPFRMAMPELLLDELKGQFEDEVKKMSDLEEGMEKSEKEKEEAGGLQIENKIKIDNTEKEIKELKSRLEEIKKAEESLKHRICGELNIDPHKEVYRETWLQNQMYQLNKLEEEKNLLMDEQKLELWENNIDKNLNTEGYWIPNKDILAVKDRINSLDITVQLGTEYLSYMEEEEKQKLMVRYPILPYGLIIANEKDWQTLKDNLMEDIFLHSLVPIFIRTEMRKPLEESFKSIDNYGFRLASEAEEYLNWQKTILKKDDQIKGNIKVLTDKINLLTGLIKDGENSLKTESSIELLEKVENKNSELKELFIESSRIQSRLDKILEGLKQVKIEKANLEKANKNTENHIKNLDSFINRLKELEKERPGIDSLRLEIVEGNKRVEALEEDLNRNDKIIKNDALAYERWKIHMAISFNDIKEIVDDAAFEEESFAEKAAEVEVPPTYQVLHKEIEENINRRKALSMEAERKNGEIAIINKEIEHNKDKTAALEKQLRKIDINWREYKIKEESKDMHGIALEDIAKQLKAYKDKELENRDKITVIRVKIDNLIKEKIKIEKNIDDKYGRAPLIWENLNLAEKEREIVLSINDNEKFLSEAEKVLEDYNNEKMNIYQVLSDIKAYSRLDVLKGKVDEVLLERIKANPHGEKDNWINKIKGIEDNLARDYNIASRNIEDFNKLVKDKVTDEILKRKILQDTTDIRIDRYKSNLESFLSMKDYFQKEINSIGKDKEKAEEVREQWAQRAARHAIKIIESLKEMISGMNYLNENNHVFPLVTLKGDEALSREENEIFYSLREHFIESIKKLLKDNEDIENIDEKVIDSLMGDQAIFARALGGRYPKLMVYKMTEKNEFLYAKPRDYYYTTWEAINKGEGDRPEGSGGQTLSVNTFVIMMLMNYKKRYIGNKRSWTVLILDNPFGSASGRHVLDPIFEIADKLNFQIIAFAAPEIIKAEISERFPIFWELKIEDSKDQTFGIVAGEMIHGGRVNI